MAHLPHFVADLALILVTAGVTTLFFREVQQPVVLGYILAGVLVGPHVSLFPTVVPRPLREVSSLKLTFRFLLGE